MNTVFPVTHAPDRVRVLSPDRKGLEEGEETVTPGGTTVFRIQV